MTPEERKLILHVFALGCPSDLPENIHVELDILRRDLGVAPNEIVQRLKDMTTLGIEHEIRANDEDHAEDVLVVEWHDQTVYKDDFNDDFRFERSTEVAVRMLEVGAGERCIEHAEQWLESLDFSLLSTATTGS